MSMLSSQINELRDKARLFEGYQNGEISRMMREAADTIESLRDRLQELQGIGSESRYSELFGTTERAANSLSVLYRCELGLERVHCDDCDLHGACRVYDGEMTGLLEWLESEVRDD